MTETHPWAQRYREGSTPWDLGEAHPELQKRIQEGSQSLAPSPGKNRCLVPGCGRGWDAIALADAGWEVVALDLVADLGEELNKALAPRFSEFVHGDLFEQATIDKLLNNGQFDLIFDHTFFCAVPLDLRPELGEVFKSLLRPNGLFISLVFPIGRDHQQGGPPFGMEVEHLQNVLPAADFEINEICEEISLGGRRAWASAWAEFRRISI